MNSNKGLVSVIIPTYNNEKYVGEAVESALKQSYENIEIIVVDDGSKDETEKALQPYEASITYIHQANQGASAARNTGVDAASGEWIAFLDSDDLWSPKKIETQIEDLKANPKAKVHSTNLTLERSSLTTVDFFSSKGFSNEKTKSWTLEKPLKEVVQYRFPWFQTTIIHRDLVEKVGPHDTKYPLYHDYEYMLRLAMSGTQWCVNSDALAQVLRRDCDSNLSDLSNSKKAAMLNDWLEIHKHAIAAQYSFEKHEKATLTRALNDAYSASVRHFTELGGHKQAQDLCKEARSFGILNVTLKRLVWRLKNTNK